MVWWWIFRFMDSNSYKAFCLRDTRDTPLISHRIYRGEVEVKPCSRDRWTDRRELQLSATWLWRWGRLCDWTNNWLVVWNMNYMFFHIILGNFIIPTDFHSSFFRGVTEIPAVFQLYIDQQFFDQSIQLDYHGDQWANVYKVVPPKRYVCWLDSPQEY